MATACADAFLSVDLYLKSWKYQDETVHCLVIATQSELGGSGGGTNWDLLPV